MVLSSILNSTRGLYDKLYYYTADEKAHLFWTVDLLQLCTDPGQNTYTETDYIIQVFTHSYVWTYDESRL